MSRNIKEIGKELMGKSLNSYHRKTGLTQLEENNKMQDGILNGILSQVDDAYIEKTEQSNVIHLDGSGDGVVVLDSIEGNTMVNLFPKNYWTSLGIWNYIHFNTSMFSVGKKYTIFVKNIPNGYQWCFTTRNVSATYTQYTTGHKALFNYDSLSTENYTIHINDKGVTPLTQSQMDNIKVIILEGDYTNQDINYFEGLQSSFEEKVSNEGKYEIEILSNNKNLFDMSKTESGYIEIYTEPNIGKIVKADCLNRTSDFIKVKPSTKYTYIATVPVTNVNYATWSRVSYYDKHKRYITSTTFGGKGLLGMQTDINTTTTPSTCEYVRVGSRYLEDNNAIVSFLEGTHSEHCLLEQNKIKLLINEPLRGINNTIKDKLCVKDNRLVIERNISQVKLNGSENWENYTQAGSGSVSYAHIKLNNMYANNDINSVICDKLPSVKGSSFDYNKEMIYAWDWEGRYANAMYLHIYNERLSTQDVNGFKQWLSQNPIKIIYTLTEPYYEEVTNEYGQPIIMEGYENGTLYIDSTIVPTISVRYTPKMESFKVIKEVNNNNVMLTNDINEAIIPYMLEVDMMILEKEMAIMSHKNIRKIGEKDMTSMQKRTYDMLVRLIKGKTLTVDECKTRVTVYLNASKITDEQAEELMLLIDEVYA